MYFIPARWFIALEEAEERSKHWCSFILSELQRRFKVILPFFRQIDDTSAPVLQALRFFLAVVCCYPSNQDLVEKAYLAFRSGTEPVGNLCPTGNAHLANRHVKTCQYFGFGHNISILGAASADMEGFVRPSAVTSRTRNGCLPIPSLLEE